MALEDQNPNRPDPYAGYIAYFSAMLGIASFLGFYTIASAPVAIGMGFWAKGKGAKGVPMWIGIVGGVIALSILALRLYAQLQSLSA